MLSMNFFIVSVCIHWFTQAVRNVGGGREGNVKVTLIWGSDNIDKPDVRRI